MNSVYYNDPVFIQSDAYKIFASENPSTGYLNIRAYAANSAIPISGLNVTVSKVIDNLRVIFFEGATDSSGVISQISLPTPRQVLNDMEVPVSQEYEIKADYNNQSLLFIIKMYSNIQVNQNINIVPEMRLDGSYYGN